MASRQRRGERVAAVTALLHQNPGRLFTLGELADLFGASRSSLSEDLAVIREASLAYGLGEVRTLPGVAGGTKFLPTVGPDQARGVIADLCREVSDPRRLVAGGYIYMTDIVFSPVWAGRLGQVFALLFSSTPKDRGASVGGASAAVHATGSVAGAAASAAAAADYVVTVETKGIALALMTARCLGLPLVVARRDLRVTEGSSVTMNYVSGSTGRIQTMSLPRRSLPQGARVLVVDDFMKAGGTVRGLRDLITEFGARVLAVGILTATAQPSEKLLDDYLALTVLQGVDERRRLVSVVPGPALVGLG
jgi:purine operon repressor